MNLRQRISLGLSRLTAHIVRLPQAIFNWVGLRRQQHARALLEAERLDRIRNPHKYRGR